MNEDERGITPANVTAVTVAPLDGGGWDVTIEQGNGDVIKTLQLTDWERIQLAFMLAAPGIDKNGVHMSFVDLGR
jgi:hypothetical protein